MDRINLPFPSKVAKDAKKSQVNVLKCVGFFRAFRVFRVFRGWKMRIILFENLAPNRAVYRTAGRATVAAFPLTTHYSLLTNHQRRNKNAPK